jgi:hypothetical protein
MYNMFLFAMADTKNKNKPDQMSNTIDRGGRTELYPSITEIVVGSVAP